MPEALRIAERLLERGLSVIPVPRPIPGARIGEPGDGKVPAIAWREFQDRLPTRDELAQWFGHAAMNIGVVTGAISQVVVIDADAPDALLWCTKNLPYTPWQTKTARGFHLFYRHPGGRVPNRARLETRDGRMPIDVRGDGGFVIAGGSVHASGAEYREAGDWTAGRDELPAFWVGWLQRPSRSSTPQPIAPRSPRDVVERARRYLAAIPRPEIGHGSDNATLYAACRLTRGFGLDEAIAIDLLDEWAGKRPGWTREWIAKKVASAARYGTEPIGAYR